MAGRKNIVLLNTKGEPINQYLRYKKVRTAVRRAVDISLQERIRVQVWHIDRGCEVAVVRSGKWGVGIDAAPSFTRLWEQQE